MYRLTMLQYLKPEGVMAAICEEWIEPSVNLTYFELQYQYMSGGTEKIHENPKSEKPVSC
jgi:hypothetical protein